VTSAVPAAPAKEKPAAEAPCEVAAGLFTRDGAGMGEAATASASSPISEQAASDRAADGQSALDSAAVACGGAKHRASISWFDLPDSQGPASPSESEPAGAQPLRAAAAPAPAVAAAAGSMAAKVDRKPAPAPIASAAPDAAPARLQLDGYLHPAASQRRHRRARRLMLAARLMTAAAVMVAVVVGVTLVTKTLLRARAGAVDAVTFVLVNQSVAGSRSTSLTVHLAFPGLEHDSYMLLEGDLDRLANAVPPLVIRHRDHSATVPSTSTAVIEDGDGRKRLNRVRYDLTPQEAAMLWEATSATCVIGAMRFEMTPQTVRQMHWQAQRYGYTTAVPARE
jgi:hypothetical protein